MNVSDSCRMKMRMKMNLGKRNVPRLLKWCILLSLLAYVIYLINRILSFHLVVDSVVYLSNEEDVQRVQSKLKRTIVSEREGRWKSRDAMDQMIASKLQSKNASQVKSMQSSGKCDAKKHIMFLKTHKTGSSSVQNIFLRYGDDHNLFFALPKPDNYIGHPTRFNRRLLLDPALLKSRYNVSYSMIVHHLRFNYKELNEVLPKDTFYLTILRDPVKLYESLFTYFDFSQLLLGKNITLFQFTNLYKSQLSHMSEDDGDEAEPGDRKYPQSRADTVRSAPKSNDSQLSSRNKVNSALGNNGNTLNADKSKVDGLVDKINHSIGSGSNNLINKATYGERSGTFPAHYQNTRQRHLQGNNVTTKVLVTDDTREVNSRKGSLDMATTTRDTASNEIAGERRERGAQLTAKEPSTRLDKLNSDMKERLDGENKLTMEDEDNLQDKSSSASAFFPYLTEILKPLWSSSKGDKNTKNKQIPDINRRIRGRYGRNQMAFDLGFNPRYFDKKQFVFNFIDALDSIFHLVLINEKMDESLILMKHLLCWTIDDVISFEHNRRSPEYTLKQPITGESEKIIRSLNSADQLIYDHFYDKLNQMIEMFGVQKMAREVKELRRKRELLYKKCVHSTDLMSNIVPQQSSIVTKYHSTVKNNSQLSSVFTHSMASRGKKINPQWASPKVLGMKVNPKTDQNKLCTQLTMRELTYTAKLRKKQGQLLSSKKLVLSGFNVKLEVLAQNQVDYYFRN